MKKIICMLLSLCMLLCGVAFAEGTAAMPEVGIDFGENAVLVQEDYSQDGGYMQQYSVVTSMAYVMVMTGEITVQDMMASFEMTQPTSYVLVSDEGGVKERIVYKSEIDNMAIDAAAVWHNGYSVLVMLMGEKVTYEGANQQEWMTGWLENMTLDGQQPVTDMAAAIAATEAKLGDAVNMADVVIGIPVVEINFGGKGVMVSQNDVQNARLQVYSVDDYNVYVISYLGEYLCDGVWQSLVYELHDNTTLTEDENGIRQRKVYDYAAVGQTGDVTVVWRNGCTVAVVVSVPNEAYADGMQDTITQWIHSMIIDGENVYIEAE